MAADTTLPPSEPSAEATADQATTNQSTYPAPRPAPPTPGGPLFEIRSIPDKGLGVVALTPIAKGTRILREPPLMVISDGRAYPAIEAAIAHRLKYLSAGQRAVFQGLHNARPDDDYPLSNTFATNALPCGNGSGRSAVYPLISRLNHACTPNCCHSWNPSLGKGEETIHALRDIEPGQELTIHYAYGHWGVTRAERRAHLAKVYGFECGCETCALPPDEVARSDARRARMRELARGIDNPRRGLLMPSIVLAECEALIALIEEDGAGAGHAANAWNDAWEIAALHGREQAAAAYARKCYQARVICEGEDHPRTQQIKIFAEDPRRWGSFGKWKREVEGFISGMYLVE